MVCDGWQVKDGMWCVMAGKLKMVCDGWQVLAGKLKMVCAGCGV